MAMPLPCIAQSSDDTSAEPLAPMAFSRLYTLRWAAVPFGKLAITGRETGAGYTINGQLKFTGVAGLFGSNESVASVTATGLDPAASGRAYDAVYTIRGKKKHIKLTYAPGGAVEELLEPDDRGAKRPFVPAELKFASVDLLSMIPALRNHVHEARQSNAREEGFRLYDGRRLMDVALTLQGSEQRVALGERVQTVKVEMRRTPVAGFSDKELAKYAEGEEPVEIYFSDDAQLLPMHVEMALMLGSIEADVVKECPPEKPCGLQ